MSDLIDRQDRDLEDFARLLISAADHIRHSIAVSSYNNCNNCAIKLTCRYLPEWGKMTRINCPLWKGEQEDRCLEKK